LFYTLHRPYDICRAAVWFMDSKQDLLSHVRKSVTNYWHSVDGAKIAEILKYYSGPAVVYIMYEGVFNRIVWTNMFLWGSGVARIWSLKSKAGQGPGDIILQQVSGVKPNLSNLMIALGRPHPPPPKGSNIFLS